MHAHFGAGGIPIEKVKQLFGTDGIRGVPGEYPLDDATIERVGFALGEHLASRKAAPDGRRPRVLVGRDTRESGPHIGETIARGLAAAGAEAVSSGVLTTPGVAWLVSREGFDAGVVISASHNPYHDNGVKLISSLGMKFPDAEEAAIEKLILSENGVSGRKAKQDHGGKMGAAGANGNQKLHEDYLDGLRATVFPGAKIAGMKIVLDCANGAASNLAPQLFRSLGANVTAINDAPDGRNINSGCGSLHPEEMQKRVVETGAALGVAFDGDADRAIFSSATGRRVDGDGVLLAAGRFLQSTGELKGSAIVGTTMANLGLERALEKSGLRLVRTDVGDRYVLEEMQRIGANLGGEQSGHILFLDDATTGDGMLTAVKIASLVAIAGPLDSLVADLKVFPQKIVNVKVKSKPPLETLPEVARTLQKAETALGKSGRVVLRYSGTEPLARVMVEAERVEEVERWTEELASALRAAIGI
ncbi:MAG TPA: phosphoglucosamine mutase [Candidatus Acidoferrales bacterium]|jgi:phosphoglucosamine mutase|nr:phosphoglucosamine mutase [Candidatus Acidoferrales bacterium]